ncbi:MAG: biopolymer transporter ExbD [Bdellovibrionales bacterium]|nr:biopolymer transporter ExbD [Bdellovibrionales bacterium]
MRRAVDKFKQNNKKSTFTLQLTAMVDMFTIMIVFLLKSYSTSAVHITPQQGLKLPHSSSYTEPVEALKLVVSLDGIYVEDQQVVPMQNGELIAGDTDANDPDFIRGLYEALDKQAEKSKEIAKLNEEHHFEGKVVMQADSRLNYKVLKKVMYTSSMAGYADLRLATVSFE